MVVLAGEILKEIREHVEQGVSSQIIIKGLRRASQMAVNKIKEIAVRTDEADRRETLAKLAGTAMTSKLIKRNTEFFTKSAFSYFMLFHYFGLAVWPANMTFPSQQQWSSTPFFPSTKKTSTRN